MLAERDFFFISRCYSLQANSVLNYVRCFHDGRELLHRRGWCGTIDVYLMCMVLVIKSQGQLTCRFTFILVFFHILPRFTIDKGIP